MDTGLRAIHPITGEDVPIYVANFVLMGYGTGAVMAVPAHDQRDWEFAKPTACRSAGDRGCRGARRAEEINSHVGRHRRRSDGGRLGDSGAIDVVEIDAAVSVVREYLRRAIEEDGAQTERGWLVNSGDFDGLDFDAGVRRDRRERWKPMARGQRRVNFRLRDWGVSRQRYWGCPIPVIHCAELRRGAGAGGPAAGGAARGRGRRLRQRRCAVADQVRPRMAQDHLPALRRRRRARDRHLRHLHGVELVLRALHQRPAPSDMVDERANYWLPVDQYIGGIEHAILHLMYFRFYHKLLRDAGLVDSDEPATRLLTQGMVIAETFYREDANGSKDWINPADVDCSTTSGCG